MDNTDLHNLFYDPENGYVNVKSLYEKTKDTNNYYTYNDVKNWYNDQPVNQVYKKKGKVKSFNKIISHYNQIGELQADLMEIKRFYHYNSHYKYLLNVIDIYSRYAWSYPIKHKKPEEVAPYLEEIFKTIPKKNYRAICVDQGNEFNGVVNGVIKKYKFKKYTNDPESINAKNTMALVERLNFTIWNRIKKYMYANNTLTFVDVLDKLIDNYNHTKHTTTKRTPYSIFYEGEVPLIPGLGLDHDDEGKLRKGDKVRVMLKRTVFTKRAVEPVYSTTIHKIIGMKNGLYILDNDKQYHKEQLIKATEKDNNIFEKLKEDNDNTMKKEKKLKEDFKMPIEKIEQQVLSSKRVKKQPVRYSDWT